MLPVSNFELAYWLLVAYKVKVVLRGRYLCMSWKQESSTNF